MLLEHCFQIIVHFMKKNNRANRTFTYIASIKADDATNRSFTSNAPIKADVAKPQNKISSETFIWNNLRRAFSLRPRCQSDSQLSSLPLSFLIKSLTTQFPLTQSPNHPQCPPLKQPWSSTSPSSLLPLDSPLTNQLRKTFDLRCKHYLPETMASLLDFVAAS